MTKSLIILILTFCCFSSVSYGDDFSTWQYCEVSNNSCEFYSCQESNRKCGGKGYLKEFATPFCNVFLNSQDFTYTSKGKRWLKDVRYCLQSRVSDIPINSTCREMEEDAFSGHVPCYTETGFCELPFLDKLQVIYKLRTAITNAKVLIASLEILQRCMTPFQKSQVKALLSR